MPTQIAVVAVDPTVRDRLAASIPPASFEVITCPPNELPANLPDLFVIALPDLETPEERLIEKVRADDATAHVPIVIVSALPMVRLQSVPYASDWTIAIVEEPVDPQVLLETMGFLLSSEQSE